MTTPDSSKLTVKYNEIVCVGLGLSGICLGAQLRRRWNFRDMHFYDRNESYSGTWWVNHYPGAACDVPIFIYAFSFAQGQPWSRLLPGHAEIRKYVSNVVSDYDLKPHMTFQTECETAIWNNERSIWSLQMQNIATGERFIHECRILFSAVGLLSQPYIPEIPGAEAFQGDSFHTARWKDEVSVDGKEVVVLGNGCSACQVVPAITPRAKSVTQIFRTPHWLLPFQNIELSPTFLSALKSVPLLVRLLRLIAFASIESGWPMFLMNRIGERIRKSAESKCRNFVTETAPEKYHEFLVPDYPIACKRRIYDSNSAYLKTLHLDNLLLTKETVTEIKPNGVLTNKNFYPADIIIYATGFMTNKSLGQLRIKGEHGVWLDEHWKELGGPSAYNTISVADYPNFFMLYGPNSNTGHTSVTVCVENAVSAALRLIAPLLEGRATKLTVRRKAYEEWAASVQKASKTRVFNRETCTNWYVSETGWNGTTYPWSQLHCWWRQMFLSWNDWEYTRNGLPVDPHASKLWILVVFLAIGTVAATTSISSLGIKHFPTFV